MINDFLDPIEAAEEAGLRYANDTSPGIQRKRRGGKFYYVDLKGNEISDPKTLARIQSLVLPPAWNEIWISPHPTDHIQATGMDGRGRKQYKYHPKWREYRDMTKYDKMVDFGQVLPLIRKQTAKDLTLPGLSKRKVVAVVVQLLEKTLIRVGNEEYAVDNKHYGLTTMRDRHVKITGTALYFDFKGKSGVEHEVMLKNARLARIVQQCQELPGQELFQYINELGERETVTSHDVNSYLQEIAGEEFTAKDFRTWAGTVLAAQALQEFSKFDSEAQAKKNVVAAIEKVASELGNTKAICRKCYIHPEILKAYLDGSLVAQLQVEVDKKLDQSIDQLHPEETAVLAFLRKGLLQEHTDETAD
jgi:DNA topoisomerase-1